MTHYSSATQPILLARLVAIRKDPASRALRFGMPRADDARGIEVLPLS